MPAPKIDGKDGAFTARTDLHLCWGKAMERRRAGGEEIVGWKTVGHGASSPALFARFLRLEGAVRAVRGVENK